jgi:hypothetical protein
MRARAASASCTESSAASVTVLQQHVAAGARARTQILERSIAFALQLALLFILAQAVSRHEREALDAIRRRPPTRYMRRMLQNNRGEGRAARTENDTACIWDGV